MAANISIGQRVCESLAALCETMQMAMYGKQKWSREISCPQLCYEPDVIIDSWFTSSWFCSFPPDSRPNFIIPYSGKVLVGECPFDKLRTGLVASGEWQVIGYGVQVGKCVDWGVLCCGMLG